MKGQVMKRLSFLQLITNSGIPNSFANKFRKRRMKLFEKYFPEVLLNESLKILDLGGTYNYWKQMGYENKNGIEIVLLNLAVEETSVKNISSIKGDACDLSLFTDKQFDIVFSNSVIEHVGNFQRQKEMAKEIMRVGKGFFIQTPNYWFPLEPHFLFFGYHYMPLWFRSLLIQNFNLGWMGKHKEKRKALEVADSVHLLSKRQLRKLFPNTFMLNEYLMGFVKSIMVIKSIAKNE